MQIKNYIGIKYKEITLVSETIMYNTTTKYI